MQMMMKRALGKPKNYQQLNVVELIIRIPIRVSADHFKNMFYLNGLKRIKEQFLLQNVGEEHQRTMSGRAPSFQFKRAYLTILSSVRRLLSFMHLIPSCPPLCSPTFPFCGGPELKSCLLQQMWERGERECHEQQWSFLPLHWSW